MYAPVLTLGALLATQTLATDMLAPFPGSGLDKRQGGESFLPDTTPGCPADWPMCGTSGICYDPNRGDICCPGGTYACPGGNFCLQDGYCCPNGLDRETCAQQHGVTLRPTTTTEPATSTASSSPTTSKAVIPTSSSSAATPSDSTLTPTMPGPSSSSPMPPVETSSPPMFTGAANAKAIGGSAVVLGGLGFIGNLLI